MNIAKDNKRSYQWLYTAKWKNLEDKLSILSGALENLCQSGSILHTQGLNNGISDRHRGDITTNS